MIALTAAGQPKLPPRTGADKADNHPARFLRPWSGNQERGGSTIIDTMYTRLVHNPRLSTGRNLAWFNLACFWVTGTDSSVLRKGPEEAPAQNRKSVLRESCVPEHLQPVGMRLTGQ